MRSFVRTLTVLLAALWLASPTVGSFGGENAGGTGVWILPSPNFVGGPPPVAGATGSVTRQVEDFDTDLRMRVHPTMGSSLVATMVDPISGLMIPLQICGREVILRGSTMRSLRDANVLGAQIVIMNAHQFGYRIDFAMASSGESGTLSIY